MLPTTFFNAAFLAAAGGAVQAFPGFRNVLEEIRQQDNIHTGPTEQSRTLLGDLAKRGATTPSGEAIQSILQGEAPAEVENSVSYSPPEGGINSLACRQDTCCIWSYIVPRMVAAFSEEGGARCSELARGAIRIGFHDAGAWNTSTPVPEFCLANDIGCGGADGSILLSPSEFSRSENRGLKDIASVLHSWYSSFNALPRLDGEDDDNDDDGNRQLVSMADLIQMSALVATVTCPGGPRIRAFVGRHDVTAAIAPPPEGLLPKPSDDAQTLIDMFAAKTLSLTDLVALIGAHTVSRQYFVEPPYAGRPQDTTDGIFDTRYYNETSTADAPSGVYRFASDVSLAADPAAQPIWASFSGADAHQH